MRYADPQIFVYFWDGDVPHPYLIKDISVTGAYLYGVQRWLPGTVITGTFCGPFEEALMIAFRVVRQGADGIGITFLLRTKEERLALEQLFSRFAPRAAAPNSTSGETMGT